MTSLFPRSCTYYISSIHCRRKVGYFYPRKVGNKPGFVWGGCFFIVVEYPFGLSCDCYTSAVFGFMKNKSWNYSCADILT